MRLVAKFNDVEIFEKLPKGSRKHLYIYTCTDLILHLRNSQKGVERQSSQQSYLSILFWVKLPKGSRKRINAFVNCSSFIYMKLPKGSRKKIEAIPGVVRVTAERKLPKGSRK